MFKIGDTYLNHEGFKFILRSVFLIDIFLKMNVIALIEVKYRYGYGKDMCLPYILG